MDVRNDQFIHFDIESEQPVLMNLTSSIVGLGR